MIMLSDNVYLGLVHTNTINMDNLKKLFSLYFGIQMAFLSKKTELFEMALQSG